MNIKFKYAICIRNFLVILYTCFCYATVEGASLEKVVEVDNTFLVSFTPCFTRILPEEFDPAAKALYDSCRTKRKVEGTKSLSDFGERYKDLSKLPSNVREYITKISTANDAIHKFIGFLDILEVKGETRLINAIAARRSLVFAAAHCIFDFDTSSLWFYQRLMMKATHAISGTSCVGNVVVDPVTGMIIKIDSKTSEIISNERDCLTHPDFGGLCDNTKTFITELLAVKEIITLLTETERLKRIKPSEKQEKKEEEKK